MRLVVIASNNLWLRLLLHGRITIEQFLVLIQFIVGRRARSIHKTARWFWVAVCGRVRGACATHLFQAYCRFIRGWLLLSDTGCPRCCRLHCLFLLMKIIRIKTNKNLQIIILEISAQTITYKLTNLIN